MRRTLARALEEVLADWTEREAEAFAAALERFSAEFARLR
jgi:hypothetical protein